MPSLKIMDIIDTILITVCGIMVCEIIYINVIMRIWI